MKEASDRELLERWRAGDRRAADELLQRHRAALQGFFRNRTRQPVDDLIQETLFQCVRSVESFRGEASFRTFLFGVAHNVLRQHYRKKDREFELTVSSLEADDPSPPSILADRSERQLLVHSLRRLPVEYQLLIELRYSRQMTSEQIAEVLFTPAATIRTRLRRARELLKSGVEQLAADLDLATATIRSFDTWAGEVRRKLGDSD